MLSCEENAYYNVDGWCPNAKPHERARSILSVYVTHTVYAVRYVQALNNEIISHNILFFSSSIEQQYEILCT